MTYIIDQTDRRILNAVARDSSRSQRELADALGMSQNALWRRLKQLEAHQVIEGYGARINRRALGHDLVVFAMVRTRHHSLEWLRQFKTHLETIPEVTDFYRIGGDYDYLLKIQTQTINGYDQVYQRITEKIALENVTSYFAMEAIFENRPGLE